MWFTPIRGYLEIASSELIKNGYSFIYLVVKFNYNKDVTRL